MVKIIIRYNFALPLHYYIVEESCSNLPSKPLSTWGTSIPNIFFQGIICVCKYNGKSVLEKKCSTAFLWQKSGCDRQQLDENFFSPFWVVSSMMISQTFGVVYYVVGGGQIWAMPGILLK